VRAPLLCRADRHRDRTCDGTVIVYSVPNEDALMEALPPAGGTRTVLWREPDLGNQATAFASDCGHLELPLLGRRGPD